MSVYRGFPDYTDVGLCRLQSTWVQSINSKSEQNNPTICQIARPGSFTKNIQENYNSVPIHQLHNMRNDAT